MDLQKLSAIQQVMETRVLSKTIVDNENRIDIDQFVSLMIKILRIDPSYTKQLIEIY